MSEAIIHRLSLHRLRVPVGRRRAAEAETAGHIETAIVRIETARGLTGFGEAAPPCLTIAPPADSVGTTIERTFARQLIEFHPASFPEALEAIEALPHENSESRCVRRVRAAVELALLDLAMRVFDRDVDAVVRWMGLPGFGSPGSADRAHPSGVVEHSEPEVMLRAFRLFRWRGIRHFKIELRRDEQCDSIARVVGYLRRGIERGKATVRVDACGRWSKDEAVEWLADNDQLPIAALEQPLPCGQEHDLPILKDLFETPLVHDESLVSVRDAHRLKDLGVADVFHIDVAKCGGLMASLRIAAFARREAIRLQLGFPVVGTDLSLAAGLQFLRMCPGIEWVDGVTTGRSQRIHVGRKAMRFGFGGRMPRVIGRAMGVEVDPRKLEKCAIEAPFVLNL